MPVTKRSQNRKRKVVFDVTVAETPRIAGATSPTLKKTRGLDVLCPCKEELHQEKLVLESLGSMVATLASSNRMESNATVFDVQDVSKHEAGSSVPEKSPIEQQQSPSNWWEMFERLSAFHAQHNDLCIADTADAQLHNWVQNQRDLFDRPNSYLSTRQRAALAQIGLNMVQWKTMFEKLSDFATSHGHIRVTSKHDSDLSRWIEEQRHPIHPLNQEQQTLLNTIPGWRPSPPKTKCQKKQNSTRDDDDDDDTVVDQEAGDGCVHRKGSTKCSATTKKDQAWDAQYSKLKVLYERHGHCNLPKGEVNDIVDPSLKVWVNTQRSTYRQNKMPQNRIDKLDSINFVWSLERSWNDQYEKLIQYNRDQGHCHVPHSWNKVDSHLVQWVNRQRKLFKTGSLPQERIDKLNEIGFVFNAAELRGNNKGSRAKAVAGSTKKGKQQKVQQSSRERLIVNNQKLQCQQTKVDSNQEELDRQQKQLEENGEILQFLLQKLSTR